MGGSYWKILYDCGFLVGSQGGQRLLDMVISRKIDEKIPIRSFLPILMETQTPHVFERKTNSRHQKEFEEILCRIRCCRQTKSFRNLQRIAGKTPSCQEKVRRLQDEMAAQKEQRMALRNGIDTDHYQVDDQELEEEVVEFLVSEDIS